jgi:acyl-CoA reductase-like NAD-dependent aldehyde dehydrogenase
MAAYSMVIDGETRAANETFGVINPATGAVYAEAPLCSREQLDEAMAAARKAQLSWRKDEDARREALRKAASLLMNAANDLAPVLTQEQGKPRGQSMVEFLGGGMFMQYFADLELPHEVIQDDDNAFVEILGKPLGVVAAITPWNFPIVIAVAKFAPALRAGNTVVLKPSPYTPLSSLKMGELLNEVFPPGVFNVVSGDDELGQWMTAHPVPRKIAFTGSVATGKHVAVSAARDLKRVTLELGGNDPAIVLDDADVLVVAEGIFNFSFANSGQICSAIKRVYVPDSMHDELVEALAERARAAKVGDGMEEGTEYGPLNNEPQYERVKGLVAEALGQGARAAAGGGPIDRDGYFFDLTVLGGATEGQRIVDEEQFGPALPVLAYRDVEEAVERANATMFGLGGSVWSSDPERGAEVAGMLECGTAWVNTHLIAGPSQPFGGHKWSGIGVELGPWGLHEFTDMQVRYRAAK